MEDSKYGVCEGCGVPLEPVWFIGDEVDYHVGYPYLTGRKRRAVDVLVCPCCFKEHCVDDTFDGPWYK
jgi:hypothetical protein